MHNLSITILIVLLFCKSSAALGDHGILSGPWKPIHDVTIPDVVDIAEYAVDRHNKMDLASLEFKKIVKGYYQVVVGTNYNLTITAADGSTEGNYVAFVWDEPWDQQRQLMSFKGPV